MFPYSSFDSLFPEDFFGYRYPENFHSRREVNNIRAKRNAQQKVLREKELLDDALQRGDSEEAATLARQLAASKQRLLGLSRSISSEQIAGEADETIKTAQRYNLMGPQNQLSKLTVNKKPNRPNKKKKEQNDDKAVKTMKSDDGKRHRVPVIDEEVSDEERGKAKQKEKELEKEKEPEKIQEIEPEKIQEQEQAGVEEVETQKEANKIEGETGSQVMDLDETKAEEEKSKKEIEQICSNTRDALEKSKKFHERAVYLVDELQKFKKEFYEIDGTIMDAILKLDRIIIKGEAKEMRKKAIAYYTQALKDLDESVKPLNEFELNFKSQV